ncbi:head-tail connector protein [Pacificoceanicola onchidii]|uniref:head-tail connector protein n=1 Tax=Pacificoceanicola onchidii TaxID=2562685 RepID=UPI0010A2AB69|nr:head-tail connector protein [Pacificoceanicola onchidii]
MRPFRVVAPQGTLVPIEDLRDHVRADTGEQDLRLASFERAAVAYLDGYTGRLGRCILRQKWAQPLNGTEKLVDLPFPDCREFSVEQRDSEGAWSEVANVTVTVVDDCALLEGLPLDQSGIHLMFWAGWDTPDEVPENLKQAVFLLATHWNDNRSAINHSGANSELPYGVETMLQPFVQVFG